MGITRQTLDNWIKGVNVPDLVNIQKASNLLDFRFDGSVDLEPKEIESTSNSDYLESLKEQVRDLREDKKVLLREKKELMEQLKGCFELTKKYTQEVIKRA